MEKIGLLYFRRRLPRPERCHPRRRVLNGVKKYGYEFVGFRDGWRGVVEGDYMDLPARRSAVWHPRAAPSSAPPQPTFDGPNGGPENIEIMMERHGIDAIVAIGGEGTLAGAKRLADRRPARHRCPQDHDNDLRATDYTFGFDTAVSIATRQWTASAPPVNRTHRCMVAGSWAATSAGLHCTPAWRGAHAIPDPRGQGLHGAGCKLGQVHDRGRSPLVVVAEASSRRLRRRHGKQGVPEDGRPRLGGIGDYITHEIEKMTGVEDP